MTRERLLKEAAMWQRIAAADHSRMELARTYSDDAGVWMMFSQRASELARYYLFQAIEKEPHNGN